MLDQTFYDKNEIKPFNVQIMDARRFVTENRCMPVTSFFIKEPSSQEFHKDGMFSETIFGQIGTEDRLFTFGYIALNTEVLNPFMFKQIVKLGALYDEIASGKAYAEWDPIRQDFKRYDGDPAKNNAAQTGYAFFLEHYHEIKFSETPSDQRDARIMLVDKYRSLSLTDVVPILPAGLRDIEVEDGRMTQDDVNKLYISLLAQASSIPPGSKSYVYDNIRYSVQKKLVQIHEYFIDLLDDKRGFFQGSYGRRKIALGTRNVITAANYTMSDPDDKQALGPNETKVGLFQTMKAFTPLTIHHFKRAFSDPIFGSGDTYRVALTDPDTLELSYFDMNIDDITSYTSVEGIQKWINRFENTDVRELPMMTRDKSGKKLYVCLVYDDGDQISLCRSFTDLQRRIPDADKSKLRCITWAEAFYLITFAAIQNKHMYVTRYPVTEDGSVYPSKIHLMTTDPGRVVKLFDLILEQDTIEYPQYPILGKKRYVDSMILDTSRLAGLGADHDGDMVSGNSVLTDDANEEISQYMESYANYLSPEKKFLSGGTTNLINMTLMNMTSQKTLTSFVITEDDLKAA